jgi:hypothetical protein
VWLRAGVCIYVVLCCGWGWFLVDHPHLQLFFWVVNQFNFQVPTPRLDSDDVIWDVCAPGSSAVRGRRKDILKTAQLSLKDPHVPAPTAKAEETLERITTE